ncbi:hypothetical protein ACAW74_01495 [Fibrella sp. WM1]|uniref:hypothetical protein n=1 Tax=Fibrella musci TaxID=3242485 RepID=UPI0035222A84
MPSVDLRFFAPEENTKPRAKRTVRKPVKVTGYISSGGKIVLPQKSVSQLGFDPESTRFKIGAEQGKRKVKVLYMVPVSGDEAGTFAFSKAAKSYTIAMAIILTKNGIDYSDKKYTFTIAPFEFDENVTGYELKFEDPADKPAYTGKRRGPKPKNQEA